MKKFVGILVFGIIFLLAFVNNSFAAEEVSVKLEMDKSVLNTGDEVAVTISATSSATSDIMGLGGTIEFNKNVFELVTIDYNTAIEEADSIMATILSEMKKEMEAQGKECKLICVNENWCITLVEEQGISAFLAITISSPIKNASAYTEIGDIKFKVKGTGSSSTEKISLTNMKATAGSNSSTSIEASNASTQSITINAGGAGSMDDIPSLKPSNSADNSDEKKETSQSTTTNSQTANTNAPDAGVEDLIPFAVIIMALGVFGYVKYNKYRGI
ncbi:MAG: hypothetical protein E7310_03450 [Clostridiales bacterium]|nr:hypothetical protein [Clostridiales bacterium]